jgi:hypothetical protein
MPGFIRGGLEGFEEHGLDYAAASLEPQSKVDLQN